MLTRFCCYIFETTKRGGLCLIVSASFVLFGGHSYGAERNKSVLYLEHFENPPFIYKANSEFRGALPDIIRSLIKGTGYDLRISIVPSERIFYEALKGRGDIFIVHTYSGLSFNDYPDWISICRNPIGSFPIKLFFSKESLSFLTMDEIRKLRVGVVRFAKFKRGLTKSQNFPNIHRFEDTSKLFKAINTGRVDVGVSDIYSMRAIANIHNKPIPFHSNINVGLLTGFFAMPKTSKNQSTLFDDVCNELKGWGEEDRLSKIIDRHILKVSNLLPID